VKSFLLSLKINDDFSLFYLQVLAWADVKHPVCDNPYKFACGNFLNQYKNHEFYLMNTGKWKIPISFYEFISKMALIRGSEGKNSINFLKFKLQSNCCSSFFLKLPQFPIKSNHGRQGPEKSYSFFFLKYSSQTIEVSFAFFD
jgi:hypothetical protein